MFDDTDEYLLWDKILIMDFERRTEVWKRKRMRDLLIT